MPAPLYYCSRLSDVGSYDPIVWQFPTALQVPPIGPEAVRLLQWPSTASSGRRLILVTTGGSYLFPAGLLFSSSSIMDLSPPEDPKLWLSTEL
jgi:hypothetical protein